MRDNDINKGVGLILVKDDCILVGIRADDDGIGGPGGHIKKGESALEAVLRECKEEFNIIPQNMIYVGKIVSDDKKYSDSELFLSFEYTGRIKINNEFKYSMFVSPTQLLEMQLFPPFRDSLKLLLESYKNKRDQEFDGGIGSGRYPKGSGRNKNNGIKLPKQEFAAVTSSINTYYHARFKGKRKGILAHGNYTYRFVIREFNDYVIIKKKKIK